MAGLRSQSLRVDIWHTSQDFLNFPPDITMNQRSVQADLALRAVLEEKKLSTVAVACVSSPHHSLFFYDVSMCEDHLSARVKSRSRR